MISLYKLHGNQRKLSSYKQEQWSNSELSTHHLSDISHQIDRQQLPCMETADSQHGIWAFFRKSYSERKPTREEALPKEMWKQRKEVRKEMLRDRN
ncbi:hypothetical protein Csa_004737 [Cucumis sativus]|uniref:Uncharacterized protein n=1 Tax=Cucumis sativus TaxID=3659 RepID=A0A0A0KM96_CUCSA|nr:hypothetical protein Csa_004737 [Cucumis sativus]